MEQTLRSRRAYIPAGRLNSKRMGELAELEFMYRAASHGIGVAKPYGDSFPYDFLTQHGRRLLRIQVKSCFRGALSGDNGFPLHVTCLSGQDHYTIDNVDFIAAFVAKHDTWYLIPMESVGNKKGINLYPGKRRIKPGCGLYEQYRESWHLLLDEGAKGNV
ncbi:MAG TPA: group I intron-associated PD-(D/E)XK endonuclease [Terriglobales bacterium]|nr:group I intron-associated PD-(D/E)XK endonuclease [Terriglobales bacterium]